MRALPVLGVVALAAIAVWYFRDAIGERKGATFLMLLITFGGAILFFGTIASAARIREGILTFHVFGIRTRTIRLDSITTFELERIGAMKFLVIHQGTRKCLAPTRVGVDELAELLRRNGVAERKNKLVGSASVDE